MAEQVTNATAAPFTQARTDVAQVPSIQFLRVKSNAMLQQEDDLRNREKMLTSNESVASQLAQYIESLWWKARNGKRDVTDKLLESLRRRKGLYQPSHIAEIQKQGGTTIYFKITEEKCNDAESWIADIVLPAEGRPWALKPTPKPDLPPQVVQRVLQQTLDEFEERGFATPDEEIEVFVEKLRDEARNKIIEEAKSRSERMAELIDDEFIEGNFPEALDMGIEDLVTYGTMIVKGPFIESERTLEWLSENDEFMPDVTERPMIKYKRVDPFKWFPSRGAKDTTQKGMVYGVEIDEFTRNALKAMKGQEGWNDRELELVLSENKKGTTVQLDTNAEVRTLEDRSDGGINDNPDDKFQGKWFIGLTPGWMLLEWGMTGLDRTADYDIVALKLGQRVVHARLNADPLGARNYHRTVYKPVKGSFWGSGVPILISDTQDSANGAGRALINNMAIASGPQVVINDVESMREGERIQVLFPWKIWQFDQQGNRRRPPIEFFQPTDNAQKLMAIFDRFLELADRRTGIPRFPDAGAGRGAAGTATGLSIIMNSASRVLKRSVQYIDRYIIRPIVTQTFNWNMRFVSDPGIKGDVRVEASGAMGLFVREQQQLRLQEYIGLTSNPDDRALIGEKGRAELLRAGAEGLPVPTEKVIPTEAEIEQRQEQARTAALQAGQPGQPGGGQQPLALPPASLGPAIV